MEKTITKNGNEGSVSPVIDSDVMNAALLAANNPREAQNAARVASDEVRMIYDKDITGPDRESVGISAFDGGMCVKHYPMIISLQHPTITIRRHLSLDEAIGIRDALTAAIAALDKGTTGAP
jgi:hypothetical protein